MSAHVGSHARAVVFCLAAIILSQLVGVLAKVALFEVPAFTFVWVQLAAAGVFMLGYTVLVRRDSWPRGLAAIDWAAVVFISVVNFGLVRLLMMMSIERLPMNTFVFVLSFVSLATMVLSILFLRERPGRLQVMGVVLAIGGVWLFFPEIPASVERKGILYALIIVVGLAATNNVTRWLMTRQRDVLPSSLLSTLALAIGGIPVILAGLSMDWPPPIGGLKNGLIILANGIVGIALVQTVFNSMLKTLRSYEASVLAGSGIVWTVLLAIPILGERLEWRQIVAIIVVMTGVLLAQNRPREAT
jgi:drug/metabolite transporter (DMT)-like permease